MRRDELAVGLECVRVESSQSPKARRMDRECLDAAAAELRKRCGTCECFRVNLTCFNTGALLPSDGSGFCHNWTPKADDKAGR